MTSDCNQVANFKRVGGRQRQWVNPADFTEPPNETMLMLIGMKNEGHSWRSLADELNAHAEEGQRVSHELVRRVALGRCNSPRIEYALGLRSDPMPIHPCPECGRYHKQRKSCKPARKRPGKRKLVFELDEDEFERRRDAVDSHPDGRAAWLRERT